MPLTLHVDHGLGDCVHIAHLLNVYRRAFDVTCAVRTVPDKEWLFKAAGIELIGSDDTQDLVYSDPMPFTGQPEYWRFNKTVFATQQDHLPVCAAPDEIWSLLKCVNKPDYRSALGSEPHVIETLLSGLPRPITLMHLSGHTNNVRKHLSSETARRIALALRDMYNGSIVTIGSPLGSGPSYRGLPSAQFLRNIPLWVALLASVDLLIGVDAGPLHLSRYTGTKAIGYCPSAFHFPSRFALPGDNYRFVVPSHLGHLAKLVARDYCISVFDDDPAETIVQQAERML